MDKPPIKLPDEPFVSVVGHLQPVPTDPATRELLRDQCRYQPDATKGADLKNFNREQRAVLELVCTLAPEDGPIAGEAALGLAFLLHAHKLDSPLQWGNAYFRCRDCDEAHDCTGLEIWELRPDTECCSCECGASLFLADLRLSEGWVKQVLESPR